MTPADIFPLALAEQAHACAAILLFNFSLFLLLVIKMSKSQTSAMGAEQTIKSKPISRRLWVLLQHMTGDMVLSNNLANIILSHDHSRKSLRMANYCI
jgi:hypothetical protein